MEFRDYRKGEGGKREKKKTTTPTTRVNLLNPNLN